MATYFAAVQGDPITGSKGGYVIAKPRFREIDGRDGAQIGDEAFCATCGTNGLIALGVTLKGVRPTHNGVDWAIGGDLVLCKCPNPPKIIPIYGRAARFADLPSASNLAQPVFAPRICFECLMHAAENGASMLVRT